MAKVANKIMNSIFNTKCSICGARVKKGDPIRYLDGTIICHWDDEEVAEEYEWYYEANRLPVIAAGNPEEPFPYREEENLATTP